MNDRTAGENPMQTFSQEWAGAKTDAERTAVLAKLRADLDARKAAAAPIMAAWRNNDIVGCQKAQRAFRRKFAK